MAIGRAIVRDARLFLFDEPLSNLDAQLRDEMRAEIKRLHQELGRTMIYVTHDQIEAMTLADRIILLRDGQIEQSGAPLDLFERPATRFVAGFLGSPKMNFLAARIVDGAIELSDGTRLAMPAAARIGSSAVRSSEFVRSTLPAPARRWPRGHVRLPVVVELVQPTGSHVHITFPWAETGWSPSSMPTTSRGRVRKLPSIST